MKIIIYTSLIFTILASACKDGENPQPTEIILSYDFEYDEEEWIGGFSDLPLEDQELYELDIVHTPLPEETGVMGNAIRIQGHNRSDDLFMFLKKYVSGLEPLSSYEVIFNIEMASQYPENS